MNSRLSFSSRDDTGQGPTWSLPGTMANLPPATGMNVSDSASVNYFESPSRGPPSAARGSIRGAPTPQSTTPVRPTTARNATPVRATDRADSDLPQKILAFLAPMKESHQQGVHVKVITSQLGKEIPGLTVDKVRHSLETLENAGEAYFGRNNDMWCAI